MISGITDRVRGITTLVARLTLTSLLVRVGIFLVTLTSFVMAYPTQVLFGRLGGLLLVIALTPALFPRRIAPTAATLLAVAGWLLHTSWYGEPIAMWRLLGLAALLYLGHSLCALAAVLPYDAVVTSEVPARWVMRALAVTLAGSVLSVLLMSLADSGGDRGSLAAALGGLVLAVIVAAMLGWLLRRK